MSPERDGREYPTRPVVGVGAVVVVSEADRALLNVGDDVVLPGVVLVRRRHEPLAGEWSLPGGTLEVGETLVEGVAREVAEETGLAVTVGPVVEVFDRIMQDESGRVRYHFVLVDYVCRPAGGRLMSGSDASDVIIADPSALDPYSLTEKTRAVIARALTLA